MASSTTSPLTAPAAGAAEVLNQSTCLALLRSVEIGRLAVIVDGQPEIFPINFIVDHGGVVFRTAAHTTISQAALAGAVAFEADGLSSSDQASDGMAWSVLIKGQAQSIANVPDLVETATLPLHSWYGEVDPSHRQMFIRITPTSISGRRFLVQRQEQLRVSTVRSAPE